jgi:hypothetical protein
MRFVERSGMRVSFGSAQYIPIGGDAMVSLDVVFFRRQTLIAAKSGNCVLYRDTTQLKRRLFCTHSGW